jgi:PIN domain nuclease of toxin-antitoxin system
MHLLLDTHAFLWYISGSKELSSNAKNIINSPENELLISIASIWEISIKYSLGKLKIHGSFDSIAEDINQNAIEIVPISFIHTKILTKLPFYHRDPFDRLIASQAIEEDCNLISKDAIFDIYLSDKEINRIW